jgi:predicted phosphodiesterase
MLLGMVGDTHGNTQFLVDVLNKFGAMRNVQHVVVLGDFGYWPHFYDGVVFLDDVNRAAEANRLSIYCVPGNHENHDHWNWAVENMPTSKGFAYVRTRVLLAPKVLYWKWAGKQFLAVGGAVSIDKEGRRAREHDHRDAFGNRRKGTGPRTLWWPDEQLSDEELATVRDEKVDFLFTHDCSNRTPFRHRLKPDIDSVAHRAKIDMVLDRARPEMHFHGHMHERYEWDNPTGNVVSGVFPTEYDHYTKTYGLECDGMWDSWGVLDTDTGEFKFRGVA